MHSRAGMIPSYVKSSTNPVTAAVVLIDQLELVTPKHKLLY